MPENASAKKLQQTVKPKEVNKLSAAQRAIRSVYDQDEELEEDVTVELEGFDKAEEADSLGAFRDSWSRLKFWKNNVDFSINGTQFKGKEDEQVRAGVVELGKGVAADMSPVTMVGLKGNRALALSQGKGPQVVYYDRNTNSLHDLNPDRNPFSNGFVELSQDTLTGYIPAEGQFEPALDFVLSYRGVRLDTKGAALENATAILKTLDEPDLEFTLSDVEIRDGGLTMGQMSLMEVTDANNRIDEDKKDELVDKLDPDAKAQEDKEEDKSGEGKSEEDKTDEEIKQIEGELDSQYEESINAPKKVNDPISMEFNLLFSDKDTKMVDYTDLIALHERMPEEAKKYVDERKKVYEAKKAEDDYAKKNNLDAPERKAYKDLSILDYALALIGKGENKGIVKKRISTGWNSLKKLFQNGEMLDPTEEERADLGLSTDKEVDRQIIENAGGNIYIFYPWLYGKVFLRPNFSLIFTKNVSFKPKLNMSLDDIKEKAVDISLKTNSENMTESVNEVKDMLLAAIELETGVYLGIKGHVKADVGLGLFVDARTLLRLSGSIFATLNLMGTGADETFASGKVVTTTGLADYNPASFFDNFASKGTTADIHAGASINASITANINATSELFGVNKDLFNKDFAKWTLAAIDWNAKMSTPKNGDFWNLQFQSSVFSAQAVGKQIKQHGNNTFGFSFDTDNPELINTLNAARKDVKETNEVLNKYSEAEEAEGGLASLTPEKKESLIGELSLAQNNLEHVLVGINKIEEKARKDENYLIEVKDIKEKLQIHEYRFNKLKNWAEGKDEEDLNDKAFDYYKTEFGKEEEVSKGMENKIEELASEAIATREELKKFELSRITDIQKKNREVIRQLMDYIDASGITDMNTPNQNLTNYYYEIAKKDIDYSLSDYASADDLIQYERDRLAEDNEDRNRRIFALINKMVELNITEDKRDQPDKEFLDFYKNYNDYEGYDDSTRWQRIKGSTKVKFKEKKNKYIGKSLFRSPLEFGLADIDTIIAYEESELVRDEDASKAYIAFREIEAYKTKYEKETDDNEKEILLNRAKAVLFDGRTISDVRKESYRWATGQELLDYEQQKVATNKNDQLNKRTTIKDLLKGVDYTGLKEYFISNEKRKEIIKENVSIPTIIIYENGRKHYYEGKNKKDKAKKHEDRAKYLSQEYDKANEINDPEMKKLHIDRIRADYFSGKADFISRENVQNASAVSGFLDGAVKGNYIADDEAIIEALKTEIGKQKHVKNFLISDNHYELEQKLLKLQEEKESDVHMVEIYKDARGSQFKHFQEDYARKNRNLKKSEITMEQMYRFAESKARETSTHSWYVKTRKKAAELAKWGINKGAGAAAGKELDLIELKDEKDKTIMSTGGHLERIQRLRELKNSDEFKELSNEEKIKKLQDLYENHLGGGRGLTNYVNEHADALVTPNMILEYEDRRLKEESQKRIDRIELLKSGKKEEYRALAKRDGSGFKDTIKKISSVVNPFFKLGADKALKDKNILKPIDLINFQYKEMDRLTKKYSERFAFLSDKSLTDKDAWEGYRDKFGGGKAFLKFNAGKLEGKKNLIKSTQFGSGSFSYQNLSGFEEAQADIYRQRLKRANMQFTRSANEKKVIEAKIKKIKESIARLREAK